MSYSPQPHRASLKEAGPKTPRNAYSEGEDEAPELLEQEPADIEREAPETGNAPVESDAEPDSPDPPLLDE